MQILSNKENNRIVGRENTHVGNTSIVKNSSLLHNTVIITLRANTPLLNHDLLALSSSVIRELKNVRRPLTSCAHISTHRDNVNSRAVKSFVDDVVFMV